MPELETIALTVATTIAAVEPDRESLCLGVVTPEEAEVAPGNVTHHHERHNAKVYASLANAR